MPATATSTSAITELGGKYVLDRSCSETVTQNVTGGTGVIYMVEIDNEANATTSYLKILDAQTATPSDSQDNSTVTPHYTFIAPAYSKACYFIPNGAEFTGGLSMWCVSGSNVGNTTPPNNNVIVKLITT